MFKASFEASVEGYCLTSYKASLHAYVTSYYKARVDCYLKASFKISQLLLKLAFKSLYTILLQLRSKLQ